MRTRTPREAALDFDLSEEQQLLRKTVRDFAEKEIGPHSREWDEAQGKAYFIGDPSIGQLKVSFFGPFYGSYNVFELGENYEYSMVAGPNRSYLWILAREAQLPQALLDELTDILGPLDLPVDDATRLELMGRLGRAGEAHREAVYAE